MKAIDLIAKNSVAILAALILTACGGGGSDSGSSGSGASTSVSVPNVVGESQAAAGGAITAAGLTVGTVTTQSSATIASGEVISESPAAATSVTQGSAVTLVISSGPAPVSVPNVVGDTQAAASAALTAAGLTVGTVTTQSSGTVASGKVISENPAAATSVAKGSAVALVVSSGPAKFTVGGTLIGLGASATVQVLNGTDTLTVSTNGAFTLPTALLTGGAYTVTVGTPTTTPAQTCTVQNGTGTIATANVTSVVVYCTYNVTAATLNGTYTSAFANFNDGVGGTTILDGAIVNTYNGAGHYSGTATFNYGGGTQTQPSSGTYAVTSANGIASFSDNTPVTGAIEGANAFCIVSSNATSGVGPGITIGVLPNAGATTASINGNYTLVNITGAVSTGAMSGYLATIAVIDGAVTGLSVANSGGTITTGNAVAETWSVTNGAITTGTESGAVSTDGDLIVLANTHSGNDPSIDLAVRQGSGVTQTTFEGVYRVSEFGGTSVSATFSKDIILFAYGNGTYSATFTANDFKVVTTDNIDTGTYTVNSDGTLTLTNSAGEVYTGAIAADGNALVLASITGIQAPAVFAGVRE